MSEVQRKIQLSRCKFIAQKIIDVAKNVDGEIEKCFGKDHYELYALPFAWNVRLLLTKSFAKMSVVPRLFKTFYDFYILYFPRLGLVRSVRYTGERELPADSVLVVKKLKIQRDEKSSIGENLVGCFISHGQIGSVNDVSSDLLFFEYFYINLVKPLLATYKKFSAILPTPFSVTSILTDGKRKYFVPCSIVLLIDYSKAKENKDYVFGEFLEFIETEGYVLGCIYDEYSPKIIKCKPSGPFKIVIPKIEQVDEALYGEYYLSKKAIITNVAAIIVLDENLILTNYRKSIKEGFILVFCEIPFNFDVSAFCHFGDSVDVIGEGFELKCFKIRVKKDLMEIFKDKVFRTIGYCTRTFRAEEKIIDLNTVSECKSFNWIKKDEEFLYLYTPPLTNLTSTENVRLDKLLDIVEEFRQKKDLLFDKDRHKIWIKVIRSDSFFDMFARTFNSQREIAQLYKLYTML